MKNRIIKTVEKILVPIPIVRQVFGGKGSIFMFHRVLPETARSASEFGWLADHEHSTTELEYVIDWLENKNYAFISIDSIEKFLNDNTNQKFVTFTVDDGYADAYHYIWPFFKKRNIPWTFYVCTDFPNHNFFAEGYLVQELITALQLSPMPLTLPNGDTLELNLSKSINRKDAFDTILEQQNVFGVLPFRKWIESTLEKLEVQNPNSSLFCSWKQIEEISHDSNVTIGSHSVSHCRLNNLTDTELFFELEESKKIIENYIHKPVRHFSYPYGVAGEREFKAAAKAGYKTATTVAKRNLFAHHAHKPFEWPRIDWNPGDLNQFWTRICGTRECLHYLERKLGR